MFRARRLDYCNSILAGHFQCLQLADGSEACTHTGVSIATFVQTIILLRQYLRLSPWSCSIVTYQRVCLSEMGQSLESKILSQKADPISTYSSVKHLLRSQWLLKDPMHILAPRTQVHSRLGYVSEIQKLGSGGPWWKGAAAFYYSSSERLPAEAAQSHGPSQSPWYSPLGVIGCGSTGQTSLSPQAHLGVEENLWLSVENVWGAGLAGRNSEVRTDFLDLMLHVSTVQANVGFACRPLKLHPPSHLAELISIGSFFELLHKVNTLAFLFGQQFQANSC